MSGDQCNTKQRGGEAGEGMHRHSRVEFERRACGTGRVSQGRGCGARAWRDRRCPPASTMLIPPTPRWQRAHACERDGNGSAPEHRHPGCDHRRRRQHEHRRRPVAHSHGGQREPATQPAMACSARRRSHVSAAGADAHRSSRQGPAEATVAPSKADEHGRAADPNAARATISPRSIPPEQNPTIRKTAPSGSSQSHDGSRPPSARSPRASAVDRR